MSVREGQPGMPAATLRRLIQSAGMTLGEAAEALDISRRHLHRWLAGEYRIRAWHERHIREVFGARTASGRGARKRAGTVGPKRG